MPIFLWSTVDTHERQPSRSPLEDRGAVDERGDTHRLHRLDRQLRTGDVVVVAEDTEDPERGVEAGHALDEVVGVVLTPVELVSSEHHEVGGKPRNQGVYPGDTRGGHERPGVEIGDLGDSQPVEGRGQLGMDEADGTDRGKLHGIGPGRAIEPSVPERR